METEFWMESWERGGSAISFHRKDIHPFVQTYAPPEFLRGKRVLVPLCGKTNDMMWFREHASAVIGVELAPKAIAQFFAEQQIDYQVVGERYESGDLTILNMNMFDVQPSHVGKIDFVYDRAALVALPLDMRLRYVRKIQDLMAIGSQKLVITLEYDPPLAEPPFSITPAEVWEYYASWCSIEHVEQPLLPEHGMVRKFGLNFLKEHAFMLTKTHDPR